MRRVGLTKKMPRNFRAFLCVDEHNTELNQLVAQEVSGLDCPKGTLIVATKGEDVISSSNLESFEMIAPSDHEEADTRTLLHAAHMKSQGFESIILRANDTDVLVLAIFAQAHLTFEELWLSFGV